MARKAKAKLEVFNEKKHDVAVDLGVWNVPTKWEEVTLGMFSQYLTEAAEKEKLYQQDLNRAKAEIQKGKSAMEKLEKIEDSATGIDENDPKYNMNDRDLLRIFAGKTDEEIQVLPVEAYNALMAKLSFLLDNVPEYKPMNHLHYNGVHLCVNDMETLKVGEYNDAEKVLRNNQYDYPSLLAILCREVTGVKTDHVTGFTYYVNEEYTEEFANKVFDKRRELFDTMPITVAMPIVTFFFMKSLVSSNRLENSITTIAQELRDTVQNMLDSVKSMGFKRLFMMPQTIRLKKYLKSIDSILSSSSNT